MSYEAQNVRDLSENSPVQMAQVIASLLTGRSAKATAEALDMPAQRITRWYRESSEFRKMLQEQEDAVTGAILEQAKSETVEAVLALGPRAVEVWQENLDDEDPRLRQQAATAVMGFMKGRPGGEGRPKVEGLIRDGTRAPHAGD